MSEKTLLSMILVDVSGRAMLGTIKRGLDQFSFPSGCLEPGESAAAGATREIRNKTGLEVNENAWKLVHQHRDGWRLDVVAASCNYIHGAKPMDMDAVVIMGLDRHARIAEACPDGYSQAFLMLLRKAQAVLQVP